MGEKAGRKIALPRGNHVGIVVIDLEKTIEFYSSAFGLGPFQAREQEADGLMFHGESTYAKFKTSSAPIGEFQVELIQVLEGETPHTEFLRSKGEGVNHLCFEVSDFENKMAALARKGVEPFFGYCEGPEACFAYLNTEGIGGVTFELMVHQPPKS